jgi:histidinol-phosphatase
LDTPQDREVEVSLQAILAQERPDDAFLGEEVGASGSGPRRWIVDGVDGTVLFVADQPGWATEIALEVDCHVVIGVSTSPSLGRRWWASRGNGSWTARCADEATERPQQVTVSHTQSLERASCSFILPLEALAGEELSLARRLADRCEHVAPTPGAGRSSITSGHGATMVAAGDVDVSLQWGGGPWDFAALAVIVEEAGGRFSDLDGRPRLDGCGPRLFSNARLHNQVLNMLSRLNRQASQGYL